MGGWDVYFPFDITISGKIRIPLAPISEFACGKTMLIDFPLAVSPSVKYEKAIKATTESVSLSLAHATSAREKVRELTVNIVSFEELIQAITEYLPFLRGVLMVYDPLVARNETPDDALKAHVKTQATPVRFEWASCLRNPNDMRKGGANQYSMPNASFETTLILYNLAFCYCNQAQLYARVLLGNASRNHDISSVSKLAGGTVDAEQSGPFSIRSCRRAAGILEFLETRILPYFLNCAGARFPELSVMTAAALKHLCTGQIFQLLYIQANQRSSSNKLLHSLSVSAYECYDDSYSQVCALIKEFPEIDPYYELCIGNHRILYRAISLRLKGIIKHDEDEQYGEAVAYLRVALLQIKELITNRRVEAVTFQKMFWSEADAEKEKIETTLAQYEEENSVVFHQNVPEHSQLSPRKHGARSKLAEPIPFEWPEPAFTSL